MSTDTSSVLQYLVDTVFRNIWNNVRGQYRVNVTLALAKSTYITGSFYAGSDLYTLPGAGPFLVFRASRAQLFGVTPVGDTWVSAETLLTEHTTYFHVYTAAGKLIPKSQIYLYVPAAGTTCWIAVKYAGIQSCGYARTDTFYATVYVDTNHDTRTDMASYVIPTTNASATIAALRNTIRAYMAINAAGTLVYVNGEYYTTAAALALVPSNGTRIDVILERSVAFEVVVDGSADLSYFSEKYADNRFLVHIPKANNPGNEVITHNAVEFFAVNKLTGVGRYIHRVSDTSVTQVTHNDMAISQIVLDAMKDRLAADVYVVAKVMHHGSDNVLMHEGQFLETLYTLDDATIVRCLLNKESTVLSFWTAQATETCGYVSYMFDTPESVTTTTLDTMITALSLPTVVNLTCRNHGTYLADSTTRSGRIPIPAALWSRDVYPLVYLNGLNLDSTSYSYSRPSAQSLIVTLKSALYVPPNSTVTVRLLESGSAALTPTVWVPAAGNNSITITGKECSVYKRVSIPETMLPDGSVTTTGYTQLVTSGGTLVIAEPTPGTFTITVGSSLYGQALVIYRGNNILRQEILDLDARIEALDVLTYPLQLEASDGSYVPAFNYTPDVYLNRRRLTQDIGMTVTDFGTPDAVAARYLTVVDRRYLLDSDNALVLYYHTEDALMSAQGFAVNGKASYDSAILPWHSAIGLTYVRGMVDTTVVDAGQWLTVADTTHASEYDAQMTLPDHMSAILSGYDMVDYLNRKSIINAYLGVKHPVPDTSVIVTESYALYSPFLQKILQGVVDGSFTIVNDPSLSKFKAQFAEFEYMKAVDIAFTRPKPYDLVFMDISPTIRDISLTPTQYVAAKRMINIFLEDDDRTIGDTING